MAPDKLTREAVVTRALELADAEGIEAVTIRRLAQELGVTPMALYWHFKNKEELLIGILDAVFGQLIAAPAADEPWQRRLRTVLAALVGVLRRHRWVPSIHQAVPKQRSESFRRATDYALGLLTEAGYPPQRAYQVASYLLNGATALVAGDPTGPPGLSEQDAGQWRRAHRLELESLPPGEFPCLVEYGRTLAEEPDVEDYYAFGVDLLMAAVETMAPAGRGPAAPSLPGSGG